MGYWQGALVKMGLAQPGPKISSHDRAVLDLKLQRDKMKQYQKRLQVILDREQDIAKEALKVGNKKSRALTALRQRKYQEQLLSRTDAQLQTLQELVSTIEFTQIQSTVMHGLSVGNEVLKQLHAEMSLDKVERLMDQTREGIEYQREIDETLISKMSPEEEEAVQAELLQLQRDALPSIPIEEREERVELPSVPGEEPAELSEEVKATAEKKEDRVALSA
ncbi:charged multivesicular body protein 6 [Tremella mesenterica]|uniref:Charged multivesicular body protein 6 n=1 Tax=Tremella mesenterica TaxID=5217 RepID=A0A4Q1BJ83_TREME|nr:charged multivesicular body protein 6 [Tremella mesenterica]